MTRDDKKYVQTLLGSLKDELGLSTTREAGEDLLLHYNLFSAQTVELVEMYLEEIGNE